MKDVLRHIFYIKEESLKEVSSNNEKKLYKIKLNVDLFLEVVDNKLKK